MILITAVIFLNFIGSADSLHSSQPSSQSHPKHSTRPKGREHFLKKGRSANQLFSKEAIIQTMNYIPPATGSSWNSLPFTTEDIENCELPPSFDWREWEGVSGIDTQPIYGCGGCWVYAATAVFESLIRIRTGQEIDLSEEQISSCLRNGNHTGISWQAFNFMQSNGVTTEEYIPCDFLFPVCDYELNSEYYYLNDHWILGMYEFPLDQRVKIAKYIIKSFGPVASGFIVYEDWGNYRGGIYLYDNASPSVGHHSIAIVGWKDDPSVPNGGYWIVKNDFGEEWGENGYFRIGYGECEIDMVIMFAHWDPDTPYPVFATKVGTRYFYAKESIKLDITARVPEGHTASYQATDLPDGASYDEMTGIFAWTPDDSQTGVYEIGFMAYYDEFQTSQTGIIVIVPQPHRE